MNRRDFLKAAAIAGAGLSLPHTFNALIGLAEAAGSIDLAVVSRASPRAQRKISF